MDPGLTAQASLNVPRVRELPHLPIVQLYLELQVGGSRSGRSGEGRRNDLSAGSTHRGRVIIMQKITHLHGVDGFPDAIQDLDSRRESWNGSNRQGLRCDRKDLVTSNLNYRA